MPKGKIDPRALARQEADRKAAEMHKPRLAGYTWEYIADKYGYASTGAACNRWKQSLRRNSREDIEGLITLEDDRLDAMQRAIWVRGLQGDLKAIQTLLKIGNARRTLHGLNTIRITTDTDDLKAIISANDQYDASPPVFEAPAADPEPGEDD